MREFPGLVELFPFAADDPDFGQRSLWAGIKSELQADWKLVDELVLHQAGETWRLLGRDFPGSASMIYIAWCAYHDSAHSTPSNCSF